MPDDLAEILAEQEALAHPLCEAERADFDEGPLLEAVEAALDVLQEGNVPKLSEDSVFDERGIARAVIIRPCVSRGRRIRGLPPYYSQEMLQENSPVWTGWPMYMDHVAPRVAEAMQRAGRSMKELGGQVIRPWWQADLVHEDDEKFGYLRGGTCAEIWGTPFMRQLVGNNPNLLHLSINAYPKSGRAVKLAETKAMAIEGIRPEPMGSVDFVPRGGAGGRFLPRVKRAAPKPVREREVSPPQLPYASRQMDGIDLATATAAELREHLSKNRPELLPALAEAPTPTATPTPATTTTTPDAPLTQEALTEAIEQAQQSFAKTLAERETTIKAEVEQENRVREAYRELAAEARKLIEAAPSTIPPTWKAELTARYDLTPSGPTPALANVEAEMDGEKVVKDVKTVLAESVDADVKHSLKLIAEAQGKPVVTAQGAKPPTDTPSTTSTQTPRVRESSWATELGLSTEAEDGKQSEVDVLLSEGLSA